MDQTPETVYKVVLSLTNFILRYAVVLAAIGALSMALIEAVKALMSWRDRFHQRMVIEWVKTGPMPMPPETRSSDDELRSRVYTDMIRLTTAVDGAAMSSGIAWAPWRLSAAHALFALDLPKMMGQIQDAADAALAYPHLHRELYAFVTAGASDDDVANWYDWVQHPPIRSAEDPERAKLQTDTYTRLRQHVRHRLDSLQVAGAYRWQTGNQAAAVSLGAGLLFASLLYLAMRPEHADGTRSPMYWLLLVLASLIGGIVAPVAKDLVMALKRVRSGE